MANKLQQAVLRFIKSEREHPILAGLAIGYYLLVFYYSNNFDLANSWQQLVFLFCYFAVIPAMAAYLGYKLLGLTRFRSYQRQALFVIVTSTFAFFILQNLGLNYSYKKIFLLVFAALFLISFKTANYKAVMLFILLMSVFPSVNLAVIIAEKFQDRDRWNILPDDIVSCKFQSKPNVYYIQVDGYTNATTLKNPPYSFDNSAFDSWLAGQGFTLYDDFRSNYSSTLTSNSSSFNMMHHYGSENSGFKTAREFIMSNPVVDIFKNNDYKTFFITESPYLLMNRPPIAYDYCNYSARDIPYLKDGWSAASVILPEIKSQILQNRKTANFFFIEKFDPGHIAVSKIATTGTDNERGKYIERLKAANAWLKETVSFINENDPDALVIIGADHGGFVGLEYTQQSYSKITDQQLLNSIFGVKLAIRWNSEKSAQYDANLKTSVNLFRTIFSFLSDNPKYLEHRQSDDSYNHSDMNNLEDTYIAIPDK